MFRGDNLDTYLQIIILKIRTTVILIFNQYLEYALYNMLEHTWHLVDINILTMCGTYPWLHIVCTGKLCSSVINENRLLRANVWATLVKDFAAVIVERKT